MTTYYSVADIEREHRGHWFSPSTKRFFRSRIGSTVYQGLGGVYEAESLYETVKAVLAKMDG